MHVHHKIPRHAGGTDDPENLVELTVEDHAIAHKVLYWFWKREEDRLAWLVLSGQISTQEARLAALKKRMNEPDVKERVRLATKNPKTIEKLKKSLADPKVKEKHRKAVSAGLKGKPTNNPNGRRGKNSPIRTIAGELVSR